MKGTRKKNKKVDRKKTSIEVHGLMMLPYEE